MTATDLLSSKTIEQLTCQLFDALTPGEPLEGDAGAAHLLASTPALTGRVEIGGSFEGAVELTCSLPAARGIAAAMFATTVDDLDEAAVADAVGELANIVGGGLKGLLASPTSLSLPKVASAARRSADGASASAGSREAGFSWLREPVLVRVVEAPTGGRARSGS